MVGLDLLLEKIEELECKVREDFSRRWNIILNGKKRELSTIQSKSLHELYVHAFETEREILSSKDVAKLRAFTPLDSDLSRFLWAYDWFTSSNLGKLKISRNEQYGVVTHINPFPNEEYRVEAFQRPLKSGGLILKLKEAKKIMSMSDGKDVIVFPYEPIDTGKVPRGVVTLKDIVGNYEQEPHPFALAVVGNEKHILYGYIKRYIKAMEKGWFSPNWMGQWVSIGETPNTMRPLEVGDRGIGFYNRNLLNKPEYNALATNKK